MTPPLSIGDHVEIVGPARGNIACPTGCYDSAEMDQSIDAEYEVGA